MAPDLIASNLPWSAEDRRLLARIAQLIIGDDPAGLMPSVADERILSQILSRAGQFERPIRRGLESLHDDGDVPDLDDETLGSRIDANPVLRSLLRAMMQVVAQSYYQDERVLTALGFEARPPFPAGHELEEGDWNLLAPVRERAPFYRKPS